LFNAEFGIRHRDSTVPERSGVALSFRRRRVYPYPPYGLDIFTWISVNKHGGVISDIWQITPLTEY
ncbi:hypothetical protein, partial [Pseudomonas lactis]|uniref:hypothetical protein n=1 Tax=Pseudomonas lactis TaxID=1615674 RepID=UPI001EE37CCC